jgi:putative ABC transport system permease protein
MTLLGKRELEVVGVMPGVRFNGPTEDPPLLVVEAISRQGLGGNLRLDTFTVKATGSPQTIKAAIQGAARAELKDIPFALNSLEEIRDEQLAQPRQVLLLSSLMGALALLLSLSGLYGLAAHLAESRRRELGIRVVLGAGPGRILATRARGSLLPVLPGLAAGSLLALGASRVLVHQGENFPALDSTLLLGCSLLLAGAAALAVLLPALRAAWVVPAEALRSE